MRYGPSQAQTGVCIRGICVLVAGRAGGPVPGVVGVSMRTKYRTGLLVCVAAIICRLDCVAATNDIHPGYHSRLTRAVPALETASLAAVHRAEEAKVEEERRRHAEQLREQAAKARQRKVRVDSGGNPRLLVGDANASLARIADTKHALK